VPLHPHPPRTAVLATALLAAVALLAPPAAAHDRGAAFVPQPLSTARYALPEAPVPHVVAADDGVRLHTETWLPAATATATPPARVPTILVHTPYPGLTEDAVNLALPSDAAVALEAVRHLVPRGYAVTIAHARGTGASTGCYDFSGPLDRLDGAALIDFLDGQEPGDAPWGDGTVGMYGGSETGTLQLGAATLDDPRVDALRAIVPMVAITSRYAWSFQDGVGFPGTYPFNTAGHIPWAAPDGPGDAGQAVQPDRHSCHVGHAEQGTDEQVDGSYTTYFEQRELRDEARNVTAAVLMTANFDDDIVETRQPQHFLDRLPPSTPRMLLAQQAGHTTPSATGDPVIDRADWLDVVTAWYDRWLKGLPTGVEAWPAAQVQDRTGQWRTEARWATDGARQASLALGFGNPYLGPPDGVLGAVTPRGSTEYPERSVVPQPGVDVRTFTTRDAAAVFRTARLRAPLHLSGAAELDLWVVLEQPDAHVHAQLQAFDASGAPLMPGGAIGGRSAQHLDPFVEGRFEQRVARPAPVGQPVLVQVRLRPFDVVVPAGGYLRLSVAGGLNVGPFVTAPSSSTGDVRILHDCAHLSTLRVSLPSRSSQLIDVLDGEDVARGAPVGHRPEPTPDRDGGDLFTPPRCEGRGGGAGGR
jgi:predicted acyl esterase